MAGTDSSAESPKHNACGPSASHCSPQHSSGNVNRREHTALADERTTLTPTTSTGATAAAIGTGAAAEMMMSSPPTGVQTDADGLILPKKLINPYLESSDRKQLQRELKFNNKVGKSVLNQKSELQRAYEKQRERQLQHQQQQQQQQMQDHSPTSGLKGELSRVIMERAQKVENASRSQDITSADDEDKQYVNPEYLNARAKLRTGQWGSSSGSGSGSGSGGGSGGSDLK